MEYLYDDLLDECYGEIKLGNLTFLPSEIIKNLDPIAYLEGLADFEDLMIENLDIEEKEMIEKELYSE